MEQTSSISSSKALEPFLHSPSKSSYPGSAMLDGQFDQNGANDFNAIVDASGGLVATMVEDRLRWKTSEGHGDVVNGDFHFVQNQDGYFILFPKKNSPTLSGRRVQTGTQRSPIDETTESSGIEQPMSGQIGETTKLQRLQSIVRRLRDNGVRGAFFPNHSAVAPSSELQDLQYLSNLVRTGRNSLDDFIAVDVWGRFDVDHNNVGPELSPEGQMTSSPYLSTFNEDELATKSRKHMKRASSRYPPNTNHQDGELYQERTDLSRSSSISSVSVISVDQEEPSSRYSMCAFDCWLKSHTIGDPSLEPVVPASSPNEPPKTFGVPRVYRELAPGTTRILELAPGISNAPLECALYSMAIPNVRLDSAGTILPLPEPYHALSYTWESQVRNKTLICDGSTLNVMENLYSALYHLRLPHQPRRLWVDALCINQDDVEERNEQVRHMMAIYKGAASVIVWLGDSANDSEFAISGAKFLDIREGRKAVLQRSHEKCCIDTLKRLYTAQVAFFKRPWFRRSWIRQEIAVSKKLVVICGTVEVSWYTIKRSAKRLQRLHKKLRREGALDIADFDENCIRPLEYLSCGWIFGQPVLLEFGEIRSVWYYHTGGFLDLLMAGREFEATDPRDKIYSILGIARVPLEGATFEQLHPQRPPRLEVSTEEQVEKMEVDYSKSVSEVYQYLAKYFINRDRNLDTLCILLTHRGPGSHDLPSWTPDWRVPASQIGVQKCWDFFTYKFGAAGFTQADRQDQREVGVIQVQGWLVDKISHLLTYTTDIPRPPLVPETTLTPFDSIRDLRRLCQTDLGRNCLVPRDAQPGDLVCILQGAKLPMVLRPCLPDQGARSDEGRNQIDEDVEYYDPVFELIGPCWVPDLMYGEAITDFSERDYKPSQLRLV